MLVQINYNNSTFIIGIDNRSEDLYISTILKVLIYYSIMTDKIDKTTLQCYIRDILSLLIYQQKYFYIHEYKNIIDYHISWVKSFKKI